MTTSPLRLDKLTSDHVEGHWTPNGSHSPVLKPGHFFRLKTPTGSVFYLQIQSIQTVANQPGHFLLGMLPVLGQPSLDVQSVNVLSPSLFLNAFVQDSQGPHVPMQFLNATWDLSRSGDVVYMQPTAPTLLSALVDALVTSHTPVIVVDPIGVDIHTAGLQTYDIGKTMGLSIQDIGVNTVIEWIVQALPKTIQPDATDALLRLVPATPDFIPLQYFVTHPGLKQHPAAAAMMHQLYSFHVHTLLASASDKAFQLKSIKSPLHLDISAFSLEHMRLAYEGVLKTLTRHPLPENIQIILIAPEVAASSVLSFIQGCPHRVYLLSHRETPWADLAQDTWRESRQYGQVGVEVQGRLTNDIRIFFPLEAEKDTAEHSDDVATTPMAEKSLQTFPSYFDTPSLSEDPLALENPMPEEFLTLTDPLNEPLQFEMDDPAETEMDVFAPLSTSLTEDLSFAMPSLKNASAVPALTAFDDLSAEMPTLDAMWDNPSLAVTDMPNELVGLKDMPLGPPLVDEKTAAYSLDESQDIELAPAPDELTPPEMFHDLQPELDRVESAIPMPVFDLDSAHQWDNSAAPTRLVGSEPEPEPSEAQTDPPLSKLAFNLDDHTLWDSDKPLDLAFDDDLFSDTSSIETSLSMAPLTITTTTTEEDIPKMPMAFTETSAELESLSDTNMALPGLSGLSGLEDLHFSSELPDMALDLPETLPLQSTAQISNESASNATLDLSSLGTIAQELGIADSLSLQMPVEEDEEAVFDLDSPLSVMADTSLAMPPIMPEASSDDPHLSVLTPNTALSPGEDWSHIQLGETDPLDTLYSEPQQDLALDLNFTFNFQEAEPIEDIALADDFTAAFSTPESPATQPPADPTPISIHSKKSQTTALYQAGQKVFHAKYGQGVIKRVITMNEDQLILNVTFDGVGKRLLDPNLTPLEKVS